MHMMEKKEINFFGRGGDHPETAFSAFSWSLKIIFRIS